jgi:cyclohexanone monooxygenase
MRSWTLKADLTASYVCRLLNFMERHQYAVALPKGNPREERLPFLGFTSGYVQRSIDVLPKQGRRRPAGLSELSGRPVCDPVEPD